MYKVFKVSYNQIAIYTFLTAVIVLIGCKETNRDELALLELIKKEKELLCQLASMQVDISNKWDSINILLESSLPENIPEEERKNMLSVRNANLIRMFQSYDILQNDIKMSLNETEEFDQEMTKQITILKTEFKEVEQKKLKLFQSINKTLGPEEVIRYRNLNHSIIKEKCN